MLSLDFRTWQDSSLNLATNDNSRGQPLQLVLDSEINSNAILLTNIMAYFRGGYGKGGCSQKCAENMRGLKFGRLRLAGGYSHRGLLHARPLCVALGRVYRVRGALSFRLL